MTRTDLLAFKLLTLLLYGTYKAVEWRDGRVTIRTRPFAVDVMHINSTRLRRYCRWLEKHGYVSGLEVAHGSITMFVVQPPRRAQ